MPAGGKEGKSRSPSDRPGLVVAGQTKKDSPSPLARPCPTTFSPGRSLLLPRLRPLPGGNHSLLLILLLLPSGQCPNPGPHPCGVCDADVTWRGTSYEFTSCLRWVHSRCSGLARRSQYVYGVWTCPTCASVGAQATPPATPPFPTATAPQARSHFLQININGILNSHQQLLHDNNILIACIQKSKLTSATPTLPTFPNYAVLRKDRPWGRGEALSR